MKQLLLIFISSLLALVNLNAQHHCRLCGRTNLFIPQMLIEGTDTITLSSYEILLSDVKPKSHSEFLIDSDYCLYHQAIRLAFIEGDRKLEGKVRGTLCINENGEIDFIRFNFESSHFSEKDSLYIRQVLSAPRFLPAHEHKAARANFWRFRVDFDALFRNGINDYNIITNSLIEEDNYEINLFYNKTSSIHTAAIEEIIYTAYRNAPEQSVAFFIKNQHNPKYPLWVRAIFASYLPFVAMGSYIADLCQNDLAEANDIEKLLFYRELEITQKQRQKHLDIIP